MPNSRICYSCFNSDRSCADCELCDNCCQCRPFGWIKPKRGVWHGNTGRFLGVEIEIAGGDRKLISNVVSKWGGGIVRDGSLPESGSEIVTAPARGAAFTKQIGEIVRALNAAKAYTDESCGLHCHVDGRDFDITGVRRLLRFYSIVEPALYAIIPRERRSSSYCIPYGSFFLKLKNTGNLYQTIDTIWYRDDMESVVSRKTHKFDGSRYRGLNLHSWHFRKTFEFRHFGGAIFWDDILPWANLCRSIVEFSLGSYDHRIDRMKPTRAVYNLERAVEFADTQALVLPWLRARLKKYFPNYKQTEDLMKIVPGYEHLIKKNEYFGSTAGLTDFTIALGA